MANRRHGHPEQRGVTKAELNHYLQIVQEKRDKHPEARAWETMNERWSALVEGCKDIATGGRPTNKYGRTASREIVKVGVHVSPRKVIDTVLGMYLLQEFSPGRFRSDAAFWTQLVRRVRGLTTLNSGVWTNPATGKPKRAAQELPPKAAEAMAFYLREALGVAGVSLSHALMREEERKREEKLAFYEQLGELA